MRTASPLKDRQVSDREHIVRCRHSSADSGSSKLCPYHLHWILLAGRPTGSSSGSVIWASLPWKVLRRVAPPYEWRELIRQLDEVGIEVSPRFAAAAQQSALLISMEARYSLSRFGAKSMFRHSCVPRDSGHGPDHDRPDRSGRVGAGNWRGTASMKVTEQIDAVEGIGNQPLPASGGHTNSGCILMRRCSLLAADASGL